MEIKDLVDEVIACKNKTITWVLFEAFIPNIGIEHIF
jgi:hypothetical protein